MQLFAYPRNYGKDRNRASTGNTRLPQIADNDYNTWTDTLNIRCFVDSVGDGSGTALDVSHIFFKTQGVQTVAITAVGGTAANAPVVTLPTHTTDDSNDPHTLLIDGYQNYLHPLMTPGTAQRLDFVFTGTNVQIHQILCLQEVLKLDAEDAINRIRFVQIEYDLVLSGAVRESAVRNKRYVGGLGNPRDKWRVNYSIDFLRRWSGMKDTVADALLSFIRNHKNFVVAPEYKRYPDRVFPAVFPNSEIQVRYIVGYKGAGRRIAFTVDEA